MIPLRSAHIVNADAASVERVLWSVELWSRSWAGIRIAVRPEEIRPGEMPSGELISAEQLTPGSALVLTATRRARWPAQGLPRRSAAGTFRVERPVEGPQGDETTIEGPTLIGIAGAVAGWRIRTRAANTGGGCLVTIDATCPDRRWRPGLRPRVLRFQHLFLGLATLLSREEPTPPVVVVAGVILEEGRVLAARRRYPPALAGFWECPGGKVEPGESEREALARELREEIGVEVTVGGRVGPAIRISPTLTLHAYLARIVEGRPVALDHDAITWVSAEELRSVNWLPGDVPLMEVVHRLLVHQTGANGTLDT